MINDPSNGTDLPLEAMAVTLEASQAYRVLRRLSPREAVEPPPGTETRIGLLLDVETTGLDHARDEIIELAMVPFVYGLDGTIYELQKPFQGFRQPSKPIPPDITALTGINDAMVEGQSITSEEVSAFVAKVALVIAHNAAFDRQFVERLSDEFILKPWACSMSQIDWKAEGFEGTKLPYLAMGAGFFYDRHRAAHDCLATIELLSRPLPKSGHLAMARLLEQARRPSWRICAENAPFDMKDQLKARGYRWNGDANGRPRAWFIEVEENRKEQEIQFLQTEIYRRQAAFPVHKITAYERYSNRG